MCACTFLDYCKGREHLRLIKINRVCNDFISPNQKAVTVKSLCFHGFYGHPKAWNSSTKSTIAKYNSWTVSFIVLAEQKRQHISNSLHLPQTLLQDRRANGDAKQITFKFSLQNNYHIYCVRVALESYRRKRMQCSLKTS